MSLSGMFRSLMAGKAKYGSSWLPKRRSRHLKSQMKFFGGPRYKKSAANSMWGFANKQGKKYGTNGLFGMN